MRVSAPSQFEQFERAVGVASVKNPEYTGENRCWPCTSVNFAIAVGLSLAVGAGIAALAPDRGVVTAGGASGLVFLGSLVSIYLRGYLVPGTPTLTKQYLPDRVLNWFDKAPAPSALDIDLTETLIEAGVLIDHPDEPDLVLDPAFATAWNERIDAFWNDGAAVRGSLGKLADLDPDDIEFEEYPSVLVAFYGEEQIASWESRAACVADAAAAVELAAFDSAWDQRPLAVRAELLGALRLFVEQCPACDGQVSLAHQVVSSCCSSRDVIAATCDGCNARLFEIDAPPALLNDQ